MDPCPNVCPWWATGSGLSDLKAVLAEQGDNLFPELKLIFPPKWSFRTHKEQRGIWLASLQGSGGGIGDIT